MLFNKSMFAAPPAAPVVSPTTITSGQSIIITVDCTAPYNSIDAVFLNPTNGSPKITVDPFTPYSCGSNTGAMDLPPITITSFSQDVLTATISYAERGVSGAAPTEESSPSSSITINPQISDLAVSLESTTSPSNEGDPYIATLTLENKGSAIAAVSGASIRVRVASFQVDGITLTNPDDLAGWTCTPSYNSDYKNAVLDCLYGGSIAAGQKIVFKLTGKVQDCGYIPSPSGSGESATSFSFIDAIISAANLNTSPVKYVYKDTDTSNDMAKILSNQSEWCNATTEKTDSLNSYNQRVSGSSSSSTSTSTKVPSTGYSPLVTSLMIITAGAALAGGSVLAYNKLKK